METLLVVDGSNLLFQMFYGMPARIVNAQGKAIQGTLGFVGALLKIIRMVKPTHMAVLFDGECENVRKEMDPDYKANRPDYSQMGEDDTPFSQLPDIYKALDALGICHKETETCEADDWIAGYARMYGESIHTVIVSQDSDFFQLITEKVQILRYRGEKSALCDVAYIQEKLGITPMQYACFKSMTGDTADNIRGADKIGPKTAAWLLGQYGTLEGVIENAPNITKPSIRESVIRNTQRLRTNRKLICLSGGQTLPFALDELTYQYNGMTTTQVLQAIGVR